MHYGIEHYSRRIVLIALADYSFGEIYNLTARDVHPPLFYWLLKIVAYPMDIQHTALYQYHYITAFFYLISIIICAFPVRRLFGTGIAFLTAVIIVLLPVALYLYAYVRMYSLMVPLMLGMFIYVCDTYKNNTLWSWVKLFIFALAAMYTHYYALLGAFWLLALYGVLLVVVSSKNKEYKSHLKHYLILGGMLVVCYIPWLFELYNQMVAVDKSYWISPPALKEVIYSLQYYFSPKHYEEPYSEFFSSSWPLIITYSAFISSVLIILCGLLIRADKEKKLLGLLALSAIVVTVGFILIYSFLASPVFYVRYLSCFIGWFALCCAIFISIILKDGKKWQKSIVIVFFSCFLFLSGTCYYLNEVRRSWSNPDREKEESAKMREYMKDTNGVMYSEEIMAPNLALLSMFYPEYKYRVIDDGILPPEIPYIPDYKNDPYALAPFRHLKAVPEVEVDEYGIYVTTFPESVARILGPDYEVVSHLEGSMLYKFKKKEPAE
ncbi:hypothetical protein M2451_001047 [Dysgonomonas sp. PFB1-18]|uniref:glycosyltransferase family 39 protein n=1 Tax=unclassified Dysgonomonas TaxID=2630389 RepID=UPI002474458B|nr:MULTISPECIES: glycosyltransferase family 39 protein [unclassified Dysgonomonas]MDH6308330.1 hypothetical protein [Dysgonomonas sp. PF1-14]MDH6338233.1 hypothetical protein [Dysgonomonas sp. PF1-16]MDH6379730.1 hypothetical protein [Dysgonomonas sp. PFB1-18]MDH6397181.1 hypothetical protein [Dysgonomonas sp. PF1-23]